ncbi:MAG: homoserine kinase, partial [Actinomycetota bacterium]|nr:homoserine kinase [Actinomycetota bacterium]
VSHHDAAFAAGRSALLVAALTGRPRALFAATEDRLHQQYRAAAIPQSTQLLAQLRAEGLPAVISGAGPSVLVLAREDGQVQRCHEAMPPGWRALPLTVDAAGAQILPTPH